MFQFVPTASCPVTGQHQKCLAPSSLFTPSGICAHWTPPSHRYCSRGCSHCSHSQPVFLWKCQEQHSFSCLWLLSHLCQEIVISKEQKIVKCLFSAALTLQQMSGWFKSPKRASACESEVFPVVWRPHLLLFPEHVLCSRYLPQHHPCVYATQGRAPWAPAALSCKGQLLLLTFPACPSKRACVHPSQHRSRVGCPNTALRLQRDCSLATAHKFLIPPVCSPCCNG